MRIPDARRNNYPQKRQAEMMSDCSEVQKEPNIQLRDSPKKEAKKRELVGSFRTERKVAKAQRYGEKLSHRELSKNGKTFRTLYSIRVYQKTLTTHFSLDARS